MDDKNSQNHSLRQIVDKMYPDRLNSKVLKSILFNLNKQRKIHSKEIAELILFLAETSDRNWNLEIILSSINESIDNINWRGVFESFLESDLHISSTSYLYSIVDCWIHISGIITVPYEIFFRKWNNRQNQIDFLKILLSSDEKRTQVYSNIFFERLVSKEDLLTSKFKKNVEYENNLNSVELFKCLKDIQAIEIIDIIKNKSAEYCLLGLAAVQPFCENIFDNLMIYFSEGITSQFVYHILFARYRDCTLHSFGRICESVSLTKILDILLEHKMLPVITEVPDPAILCFDIIILSSRRDHLNLEIWFSNNLKKHSSAFIKYLGNKLLFTSKKDSNNDMDGLVRVNSLKPDAEIFPFNRSIVSTVLKIIDNNIKDVSDDSINIIREIKSKMFDLKNLEKPNFSDRATAFISEVINSYVEVEESVKRLAEMVKGDEASVLFSKRVFSLLIDNYSSLFRMANSDMLAAFFGALIAKKILYKPYLKVSLQLIKNSLKNPESDREFAFAFKVLEAFFKDLPEFFFEIEDIENVKYALIKKEIILVDEDTQREVDLDEMLNFIFNKNEDISNVDDTIYKGIEQAIENLKITGSNSNSYYFSFDDSILSGNGAISNGQVIRYILRHLDKNKLDKLINYCLLQKKSFRDTIISKGFSLIKIFFTYKFANEIEYCLTLGSFLGRMLIAENQPVNLDVFDFASCILKGIEYRRISITVFFTANFLKEGSNSLIFVPQNPWLMSILDLLSEIYSCTLITVREKILEVFRHFDIKFTPKPNSRMKEHLVPYVLEFDGLLKNIISVALDFSVREICNKVVQTCLAVAKCTASTLFDKLKGENKFFLFRNLLVNLTKSLIHISSREPLKASMCGNITHFLKLSFNELPLETVYNIVSQNILICCSVIEKAGITQANEIVSSLFNELVTMDELKTSSHDFSGVDPKCTLKILSEACFVEKTNVRSIENIEYQDVRVFLRQVGKKMPVKKKDYINEEWPKLLGSDRSAYFNRIVNVIKNSPEKDDMCLGLCKYLVGHALRVDCKDEYIFEFISTIFELSPKTKRDVVGWLIYSEDFKKFSTPLIKKFIEYDFVCLEELDQSLGKMLKAEDSRFITFVLDLLNVLLLGDLKYCTVYDFICTLESLNKMNENPRVFEFFKIIEASVLKFNDSLSDASAFEEFLLTSKFNTPSDHYLAVFKEKYKINELNFISSFRSSWVHFLLYSGSYRFFKIDVLSALIKDDPYGCIKESLDILVQAYSKSQYIFYIFYCRFIIKALDHIEDTVENRALIWKVLELISPTNLPSFTTHYIEILGHPFVIKYLDKNEGFFIAKELVQIVKFNLKLNHLVVDFFNNSTSTPLKRHNIYLSYMCTHRCVSLKNIFNQNRPKFIEKCNNAFFNTFYLINKHIKPFGVYSDLIDHLSEQNNVTAFIIDNLKLLAEKGSMIEEISLLLLIRLKGSNPPYGIKAACDELCKMNGIKDIFTALEKKYFNKS